MAKVKVSAKVRAETEERLRRLARAGEVFIDGEAFKAILPNPALNSGDDYCVDEARFIPVKQALFKLKRLEPGDCSAQAWRRFRFKDKEGVEKAAAAVVVPVDPHPKDVKGAHPVSPAMEEAFQGRVGVEELEFRGAPLLSVYAPIRDSFEDVVGVVEVFGSLAPEKTRVDMLDY
jgi:hypothetical protein